MPDETASTEAAVQAACRDHDYAVAATAAMEAYAVEIYSFLLAQFHGNASAADEVFSEFKEDFWRGLPKFEWRCSVRAWCYKLARSAASRFRRSPHNKRQRRVPLSEAPWLYELPYAPRTSTQPHLRSEIKDEFQKLRDKLSPEERDLLILRVDRNLSWRDVAHAMISDREEHDEQELRRFEAALRQRFTDVKKRLRRLAQEAGLLPQD